MCRSRDSRRTVQKDGMQLLSLTWWQGNNNSLRNAGRDLQHTSLG